MAADVVMPQMGESIFEGTITKWLKKPGDKVERDEPLFEISTDKVDAEIPSPSAGVLKEIKVGEGKTVPIQTVVGVIDAAGDGAGVAKSAAPAQAPAPTPAPKAAEPARAPAPAARPQIVPPAQAARPTAPAPAAASGPAPIAAPSRPAGERIHSSPLVRRMAKEHGIDLGSIPGTGAGGRITKEDMEAAIAGSSGAGGGVSAPSVEPVAPAYSAPAPARPAASPPVAPAPVAGPGGPAAHGTQYVPALQLGVPR